MDKHSLENQVNEISSNLQYYGRKGKVFFKKNPLITVTSAFLLGVTAAFFIYSSSESESS